MYPLFYKKFAQPLTSSLGVRRKGNESGTIMIFLNNYDRKLIDTLNACLQKCYECKIAVAFVRSSGVNPIIENIEQIIERGQKVKLLTSNQMGITEPEAVESLLGIGVEVKMFLNAKRTFHPKAYIFKGAEKSEYILGSSNLSRSALIDGVEWNLYSDSQDPHSSLIEDEFDRIWNSDEAQSINKNNIDTFFSDRVKDDIVNFTKREDAVPTSSDTLQDILDTSVSYPVTKRPDSTTTWKFNLSVNKVNKLINEDDFYVVVRCNFDSPDETVFAIPSDYLNKNIFPYANQGKSPRYLFEVNKRTFQFNWQRSIKMDGKPFLLTD